MIDHLLFPYEEFSRNVLALAMIACMSGYLGVYVVVKRIVFVGVTLAELSAMGIGFAFFSAGWAGDLAIDPHAWDQIAPLVFSVAFALAGVVLMSLHHAPRRVTQESLIGVGYAVAAGLAVLLIWESSEGTDKLKNLVAGDVLYVSDQAFAVVAVAFLGLALVHIAFMKEFLASSFDKDTARTLGIPARLFDLALYLSLGIAVSVSLRAGSILLVVGLMILPAVAALLVASRFGEALALSVAIAVVASMAGTAGSVYLGGPDGLPLSPTVIAACALLLGLAFAASRLRRTGRRLFLAGMGALVACSLLLVAVSASARFFGTRLVQTNPLLADSRRPELSHEQTLAELSRLMGSTHPEDRKRAVERLADWDDPHAGDLFRAALLDSDAAVRLVAIRTLTRSKSPRATEALESFAHTHGAKLAPLETLELAKALERHRCPEAIHELIHLLERTDVAPFFKKEPYERLKRLSGISSFAQDQPAAWLEWWERVHARLEWDDAAGGFREPAGQDSGG